MIFTGAPSSKLKFFISQKKTVFPFFGDSKFVSSSPAPEPEPEPAPEPSPSFYFIDFSDISDYGEIPVYSFFYDEDFDYQTQINNFLFFD